MIGWIRLAFYAAVVAAVIGAAAAVRSHFIQEGEAIVQKKWNDQKEVDKDLRLQREAEARQEENVKRLNSERIADEQASREADRERRLALSNAAVDSMRNTIDRLNARDLSQASGNTSATAIAEGAATARKLLGICTDQYRGLAERAQRLSDQVAGLQADAEQVCRGGASASTPTQESPVVTAPN